MKKYSMMEDVKKHWTSLFIFLIPLIFSILMSWFSVKLYGHIRLSTYCGIIISFGITIYFWCIFMMLITE